MEIFLKSAKLDNVCYEIRGPALKEATRLEEEGFQIIKLNTGNLAFFGLNAPEEIVHDIIMNLPNAQAYCDSKGIFPARKAIMQECQKKRIEGVLVDDIYIGNGVSELITMTMQGLLNNGDEILIPAPDYPLWTAAATLAGGKVIHYLCDETAEWIPDLDDMKKKITPRTKGIVVINPNNPTGAVYPTAILEGIIDLARKNGLIVFADEIYDKIIYDGGTHVPMASLADDLFFVTFNGLSKVYRSCGFRAGWMVLSGNKRSAKDYIEGLDILASMRLCSNVPAQYGIQTALGGYQSINELTAPDGRLTRQRDYLHKRLSEIPGVSCVKPKGALYLFPRFDTARFGIKSDVRFIYDILQETKILTVQGTGFNWPEHDHLRFVFLPVMEQLEKVGDRMAAFLKDYRQSE
jgi:alanine-synthesizing transaminase